MQKRIPIPQAFSVRPAGATVLLINEPITRVAGEISKACFDFLLDRGLIEKYVALDAKTENATEVFLRRKPPTQIAKELEGAGYL